MPHKCFGAFLLFTLASPFLFAIKPALRVTSSPGPDTLVSERSIMTGNLVKVSVVQTCTAAYSLEDTLVKVERLTRLAKARDESQLAVFPEAL